jgi:hypothetical protein
MKTPANLNAFFTNDSAHEFVVFPKNGLASTTEGRPKRDSPGKSVSMIWFNSYQVKAPGSCPYLSIGQLEGQPQALAVAERRPHQLPQSKWRHLITVRPEYLLSLADYPTAELTPCI